MKKIKKLIILLLTLPLAVLAYLICSLWHIFGKKYKDTPSKLKKMKIEDLDIETAKTEFKIYNLEEGVAVKCEVYSCEKLYVHFVLPLIQKCKLPWGKADNASSDHRELTENILSALMTGALFMISVCCGEIMFPDEKDIIRNSVKDLA